MSERRLLDLFAQGAPSAGPRLADDVMERAQRRRRRRWAVSGACAAVALVAAIPLAVAMSRSPRAAGHVPAGAASTPATEVGKAPSDGAQVYAAGIRYLAQRLAPGSHWRVLFILDHTCANASALSGPCGAQPISAELQHDLAVALQPYARVQFVSDHAKIRDSNLTVVHDGVAVMLGRVRYVDNGAQVPVGVQCGGLCGLGETLVLKKNNGAWTVTGQTGPVSMS
ncbi:MAG: hypothetical protein ABR604_01915 [Jatrophihabitantaceae bacterium]